MTYFLNLIFGITENKKKKEFELSYEMNKNEFI